MNTGSMAYDEDLADRIRAEVCRADRPLQRVEERRMFGGLAFLVNGHMAIAASGQGGLLVRADPATSAELCDGVDVTPMVMRGREMAGWLHVSGAAADDVSRWADVGLAGVAGLPPK